MNKRYFYTDSIAAAWMSKHFGMEFESPVLRNDIPFIDLVQMIAIGMTNPIVIKEESLPILEPQIDDDVYNFSWGSFFQIKTDRDLFAVREAMKVPTKYRIVLRKGVEFMWPESEELCRN